MCYKIYFDYSTRALIGSVVVFHEAMEMITADQTRIAKNE